MRKTLAILLAISLIIVLVGCGSETTSTEDSFENKMIMEIENLIISRLTVTFGAPAAVKIKSYDIINTGENSYAVSVSALYQIYDKNSQQSSAQYSAIVEYKPETDEFEINLY